VVSALSIKISEILDHDIRLYYTSSRKNTIGKTLDATKIDD